jgi:hypothetical protein
MRMPARPHHPSVSCRQRTLKAETHEHLRRIFTTNDNPDWRLRAMWRLHVTGGWTHDALIETLADRDEHIRAWAIQLLCERRSLPRCHRDIHQNGARGQVGRRAPLSDIGASADRSGAPVGIAGELTMHGEDADDHNLPKMIWLGVEPLVGETRRPPSSARVGARFLLVADSSRGARSTVMPRTHTNRPSRRSSFVSKLNSAVSSDRSSRRRRHCRQGVCRPVSSTGSHCDRHGPRQDVDGIRDCYSAGPRKSPQCKACTIAARYTAVSQTAAHRRTAPERPPTADRRHNLTISGNCLAELVVRSRASSNTCGRMQRLKEPLPSKSRSDGAFDAVLNDVLRAGRDNFRDNNGDRQVPRKSKRVVYLGFSMR